MAALVAPRAPLVRALSDVLRQTAARGSGNPLASATASALALLSEDDPTLQVRGTLCGLPSPLRARARGFSRQPRALKKTRFCHCVV